ncbi:MAG: type II toxin-antitoxin system RelE/ParE family toxin [Lachnospiraceae bacterium]|nr:type II toxin-antitoxin system RelE/ParE family toxin [Lachnospiraceae bacterium]
MVLYDVIISPKALSQLDAYIDYIQHTLLNEQAAKAVWDDAMDTREELTRVAGSLRLCDNKKLQDLGYHKINFLRHRYLMLYRVDDTTAYVEAIYHQLQDYENTFLDEMEN